MAVKSRLIKSLAKKGYGFQIEKDGKWNILVRHGDKKMILEELGHMTILEATEWAQRAKKLTKEDIAKMFMENNVKNDEYKVGGHVVPDEMAKYFGAVEDDGAVVPDHTWDEEAELKKDTDRLHVLA